MTRIKWFFVALGLLGTVLVALKHPTLAQAVWIAPNVGLAVLNHRAGDSAQATLFSAYLAIALFGLANWWVSA